MIGAGRKRDGIRIRTKSAQSPPASICCGGRRVDPELESLIQTLYGRDQLRSGTHQWSLCTDQRTSSSLTQYKWVQTSGTVADTTGPCTETTVPLVGRRSGPVSLAPLVVTTTGPCQTTESAATPVGGRVCTDQWCLPRCHWSGPIYIVSESYWSAGLCTETTGACQIAAGRDHTVYGSDQGGVSPDYKALHKYYT
ncbi:uncharacterized protein V6R79_012567 [Siganus canaliculatus]